MLDPDFSIDRVVFTGLELMELVNSGKLKRGSPICFEEAGVEMSNKNWQSVTNKMLGYLIQTFRHRGLILIMNSPYMDFVDSSTRRLFHAEMHTQGIDQKKKTCALKPQLIQYNSRLQKFYYKRLRIMKRPRPTWNPMPVPISIWHVPRPPQDLIDAYEKKRLAFTDQLNQTIMEELQGAKEKKERKNELTGYQQKVLDGLREGKLIDEIAKDRGCSIQVVYDHIRAAERKGWKVTPQKEGSKVVSYEVTDRSSGVAVSGG